MLTKSELIKKLAEENELSQAQAGRVLDSLLDTIVAEVVKGEEVRLPGFAKFERVERAARTARNPQTGETVEVPAKQAVKITPLKAFKDAVS